MSLVDQMKVLLGRDALTEAQIKSLNMYQQIYEIPDDDPLITVLAMMGANRILLEEQGDLLLQKAKETIELHQQTLREQSALIAKELILAVGDMVAGTSVGIKYRRSLMAAIFLGGIVIGGVLVRFIWR